MKVPKAIFRQVNPTQDVQELMDKFFINTKEYVQNKLEKNVNHLFEIKSAKLTYGPNKVNLDNRITYLEFNEKYIISGMFETRTPFNDLQFTFFRDLSCLEKDRIRN